MKYVKLIFVNLLCFFFISAYADNKKNLKKLSVDLYPELQVYDGNKVIQRKTISNRESNNPVKFNGSTWRCDKSIIHCDNNSMEVVSSVSLIDNNIANFNTSLVVSFENWNEDNYLLIPAAAYNGNRFLVEPKKYPPLFSTAEYDIDKPVTITDVPRLNINPGESKIELSSGDLTTPAVGIFFVKEKKSLWILMEQKTSKGNIGITFEESEDRKRARLTISSACVREQSYGGMQLRKSDDIVPTWNEGDKVSISAKLVVDDCSSPIALMRNFLPVRKNYAKEERIDILPFSKGFELIEDKYNYESWDEGRGYYALGDKRRFNTDWQLGWVGGCMATHPLAVIGRSISRDRSFRNYDKIITQSQAKSGFYYTCGNGKEWCSDCFSQPFPDNLMLLRKNADALYYFYKYCLSQKTLNPFWSMPKNWQTPLSKLNDAFVTLWNKYGQFGQFIDIETGEIKVGGTTSAVAAIGGLSLAYAFEQKEEYLRVAKEAGRYYYKNYLYKGISNGGPGEILQNPDSESSFALLESFITLFEVTGEKEWLSYAEDAAALCATWMMSYDYEFPVASTFGRLDMKTTGSVWASTQNKHSAPGICTFSGDALFKLYRATGNSLYLDMIEDVAHNIMQYISRTDRPIANQHDGWVNERVNTSDWEGKSRVGEIFHGTTWADVSAMLTVAEIPGIYINSKENVLVSFDHVKASFKDSLIWVQNPTNFEARVKVFIDSERNKIYPQGEISRCPEILLKPGENALYRIDGKLLQRM